ncbi:MAG: GSCFA domain-containing protein [Methylobacteriaceae bacterium]|nr:GSCFA domain-containing protein [Methylobacteriaceae bacterium]
MSHPYKDLPDHALWRRAISNVAAPDLDPVVDVPFTIGAHDKVATSGSCFAQHIGRYLRESGLNYYVTETANPIAQPNIALNLGYGVFTARYGNIYTSRQLLQLLRRAFGRFTPKEDVWVEGSTKIIDPFRPNIQPDGFSSMREYRTDRESHLHHIREMFENLDVLVFTLGLTECWVSREDGAVFPLCPGVLGGTFDGRRHEFVNLDVEDVVADMTAFVSELRAVNPEARVILTVSPVPLIATAEPRHVLVSTVASKSVLRVACEKIVKACKGVAYFPSYEIVTGGFGKTSYFAEDCRSVTEDGVAHVMRVFMRHYVRNSGALRSLKELVGGFTGRSTPQTSEVEEMARVVRVMCEEEALDLANLPKSMKP